MKTNNWTKDLLRLYGRDALVVMAFKTVDGFDGIVVADYTALANCSSNGRVASLILTIQNYFLINLKCVTLTALVHLYNVYFGFLECSSSQWGLRCSGKLGSVPVL